MSLADILLPENRGPGLTKAELERAQAEAGAAFPPDLLEFLEEVMPVGRGFPDWRNDAAAAMRDWQDGMRRGWVADVKNGFWLNDWGVRPADPRAAEAHVVEILDGAPRLIPIYGHRGIPNEPLEAGNPVFSMYGPDTIIYGRDLEQYLLNEFLPRRKSTEGPFREVRFWSSFALYDYD